MLSVSFYTLGCRLNQLETESAAGAFEGAGFTVLPWERCRDADLLAVNTCTVTSKAEQKARRVIRLLLRESSVPVIVTGCYAQLEAGRIAALETETSRRLCILPGADKDRLLDLPVFLAAEYRNGGKPDADCIRNWMHGGKGAGAFRFNPESFSFHSRAFLKIQDGCNRRCAYCRVPLARGKSQSLESAEALARLRALELQGCAEVVLTGVNTAQYRCPASGKGLGELLAFLLEHTSSAALRLSSIEPEPGLFTGDFLHALSHRRVRPHFHLSVQSGSAPVLEAMGRPYGPENIRESAALLRKVKDDPFLGCDMITGFPGESGADFEQSCALCAELDFAWIHGFPYSPRPGTDAFFRMDRVSERESVRRLGLLLEISRNGRKAYAGRWIGKTVEAVVERGRDGSASAVSANYLRLRIPAGQAAPGTAVRCRIEQLLDGSAFDAAGTISGHRLPVEKNG